MLSTIVDDKYKVIFDGVSKCYNRSLKVPHVQLLVKMVCDLLVPSSQHLRVAYGVTELGFESSHPSKEEEECKLITVRGKVILMSIGYYVA